MTTTMTAYEALAAFVKAEAIKHPDLGLSFGYIGNLERWGDDRSWCVFTNRRNTYGHSVSYYLGDTKDLSDALQGLPFHWDAFIARSYSKVRSY